MMPRPSTYEHRQRIVPGKGRTTAETMAFNNAPAAPLIDSAGCCGRDADMPRMLPIAAAARCSRLGSFAAPEHEIAKTRPAAGAYRSLARLEERRRRHHVPAKVLPKYMSAQLMSTSSTTATNRRTGRYRRLVVILDSRREAHGIILLPSV
jgi:hypothetical protein